MATEAHETPKHRLPRCEGVGENRSGAAPAMCAEIVFTHGLTRVFVLAAVFALLSLANGLLAAAVTLNRSSPQGASQLSSMPSMRHERCTSEEYPQRGIL
jgi:hypothetical protein